ncbi:putative glycosyltransferase [Senna tora]|uniref:Putative glycosyltransferase n=1 Tax=Senna tora TaxID=362788 RepID=A0A834T8M3_9FABA|nr:putative glycosyltransferase [Senna tora]
MDRGYRFLCQAETRRLLSFLGIAVALVLVVQYSELPYGKLLSSIIPSIGKISSFQMETSTVRSEMEDNNTHPNGSSSNHAFDAMASSPSPVAYELDPSTTTPAPERVEYANNFTAKDVRSPVNSVQIENINLTSQSVEHPSFAPQPMVSLPNKTSKDSETDSRSPVISVTSNATSVKSDTKDPTHKEEKPGFSQGNGSKSSIGKPVATKNSRKRPSKVVSISEMNILLQQTHASSQQLNPRKASDVDQEILQARSEIENAPIIEKDSRFNLPIYRNASMFRRSYELMEKMLKVYIYQDGDKPIFHEYMLDGIYASEGWFMKLMETNQQFVTQDPGKAHLFYIPFSSRLLQLTLYVRNSHRRSNLIDYMRNYVNMIAGKYPFWNRTNGTDHFVVACHDWGVCMVIFGLFC